MSSSQNTLDGTPADRLHRRLTSIRQKLLDSGIYLGEPNNPFLKEVTWQRIGRGYHLVTKDLKDTLEPLEHSTTNNDTTDNETNDEQPDEVDPTEFVMELAVFSAVVQVGYDDCWLTPCGHWKGPNQITKNFEDLKLSFYGEKPEHEVFSQDFGTVIANLRQIINQQIADCGSDPNAIQRGFLSNTRTNGIDRLKFRHVLFEVCSRCHPCHSIMVLTCWIHRNLTRMSRILRQNLKVRFYFSSFNDINIQYSPPKRHLGRDSC